MSKPESPKSVVLGTRVADLKNRLQEAHVTEGDMKIFQKVVALIENSQGHIHGDDLIAASFLAGSAAGSAAVLGEVDDN
jgi:hypothetical protein